MPSDVDPTLAAALRSADRVGKVDALFDYFRQQGQAFYDEEVTQMEHALQAAQLARESGAPASQVTAALLHDLGHLMMDEHNATAQFLTDDLDHEEVGADLLAPYFPPEVTEPIRLHVPAKRYLCTTDADYYGQLSNASKRSFAVQGGRLSDQEQRELQNNPHLQNALTLRRWDDQAKVVEATTAPLEDYRDAVLSCLHDQ